jgi:hypothetical protein
VTAADIKAGIEYSFNCPRLEECLKGKTDEDTSYKITSSNGKAVKVFGTQRGQTMELLKFIALAHECLPETKTDSDGN